MKIQIELDDSLLRSAVQAQVGIALSAMCREQIEKDAKEVISKSLQRIDWTGTARSEARSLLKSHVESAVTEVLGNQAYQRREAVRKIINEVALQAIKEGSK